eukprot:scaffold8567_cov277-Pinguiococcus_pyrenoidosus.AAC.2
MLIQQGCSGGALIGQDGSMWAHTNMDTLFDAYPADFTAEDGTAAGPFLAAASPLMSDGVASAAYTDAQRIASFVATGQKLPEGGRAPLPELGQAKTCKVVRRLTSVTLCPGLRIGHKKFMILRQLADDGACGFTVYARCPKGSNLALQEETSIDAWKRSGALASPRRPAASLWESSVRTTVATQERATRPWKACAPTCTLPASRRQEPPPRSTVAACAKRRGMPRGGAACALLDKAVWHVRKPLVDDCAVVPSSAGAREVGWAKVGRRVWLRTRGSKGGSSPIVPEMAARRKLLNSALARPSRSRQTSLREQFFCGYTNAQAPH